MMLTPNAALHESWREREAKTPLGTPDYGLLPMTDAPECPTVHASGRGEATLPAQVREAKLDRFRAF